VAAIIAARLFCADGTKTAEVRNGYRRALLAFTTSDWRNRAVLALIFRILPDAKSLRYSNATKLKRLSVRSAKKENE
jgi:hypothetical protein